MTNIINLEDRLPEDNRVEVDGSLGRIIPFSFLTKKQREFLDRNNRPTAYHLIRILQGAKTGDGCYSEAYAMYKLKEAVGDTRYKLDKRKIPEIVESLIDIGFVEYILNPDYAVFPRLKIMPDFDIKTRRGKELASRVKDYIV